MDLLATAQYGVVAALAMALLHALWQVALLTAVAAVSLSWAESSARFASVRDLFVSRRRCICAARVETSRAELARSSSTCASSCLIRALSVLISIW